MPLSLLFQLRGRFAGVTRIHQILIHSDPVSVGLSDVFVSNPSCQIIQERQNHAADPQCSSNQGESHVSAASQRCVESLEERQKPADPGIAAWRFLLAAFVLEALFIGVSLNFNVFQTYYCEHQPFAGGREIAATGALSTGIIYLGAPITSILISQFPGRRQQMVWIGWVLSIVALTAASFGTSSGTIIATQGIAYGVGVSIMHFSTISMLNEWFVAKRGLAYGILTAAESISGIAMPFTFKALLSRYGHSVTLRVTAIAFGVLSGPVIPLLQPRFLALKSNLSQNHDITLLKVPLVLAFLITAVLQGLAYRFSNLYLPNYDISLDKNTTNGVLLIVLANVSQVLGQLVLGFLSLKANPRLLLFSSPSFSVISLASLLGLAYSLKALVLFSLAYGFSGGIFIIIWAQMSLTLDHKPQFALITFGIFGCLKAIGNVLSGPISPILLASHIDMDNYGLKRHQGIVYSTGSYVISTALALTMYYAVE